VLVLASILLACASPSSQKQAAPAPVPQPRVDARVELVSIVFRLAGNREYNMGRIADYTAAVEARFRPFAEHEVVRRASYLRQSQGVSFDACMSFALHLRETDAGFALRDARAALDERWPEDLEPFVLALNDFARATDFAGFQAEHAELYALAEERLARVLQAVDMQWFGRFYGTSPSARFELAIGLLNGGANYGPRVEHADGTTSFHCVLGAWKQDADGQPAFDETMLSTVVHEFCHSFCNRYIDEQRDKLEHSLTTLWPLVAERMRKQAYGNWTTMGYESLVRASVARYLAATYDEARASEHARAQVEERGFLWTRELVQLLAQYEAQRERYSTFDEFIPRVIAFFDDYAARVTSDD